MVEGRKTRSSCCCSTAKHRCRQCPLSIACSLPWAGSLPPSKIPVGGNVRLRSRPIADCRSVIRPARMKPTWAGGLAMSFTPLRLTFGTSVRVDADPHEGRAPQQACLDRSSQARRDTLVPGESRSGSGDFGRLDSGWSGVPFTMQLRSLRRCGPKRLLGVKTSRPSTSLGIPAILTLCSHKLLPLLWSLGFAFPHVPGNGRKS